MHQGGRLKTLTLAVVIGALGCASEGDDDGSAAAAGAGGGAVSTGGDPASSTGGSPGMGTTPSGGAGGGSGGAPAGGSTGTGGTGTGGTGTGGTGAGSGGVGGSASAGSGGAGGSASAGSGGAGGSGNGSCAEDCESGGFTCCEGQCVNTGNDIFNCGACGVTCEGDSPFCNGTTCDEAPCGGCTGGQLCCAVTQGPSTVACFDPVEGTCPMGCPICDCAAADTLVATPTGEVPIAELREGDLVYSVMGDAIVPARVRATNRVPVMNHRVVRVQVQGGRTVLMSPGHPTSDWRRFDSLAPGDLLGTDRIESVELVPYPHPFTYDILPDTASGAYFADGVLVGSTLAR